MREEKRREKRPTEKKVLKNDKVQDRKKKKDFFASECAERKRDIDRKGQVNSKLFFSSSATAFCNGDYFLSFGSLIRWY